MPHCFISPEDCYGNFIAKSNNNHAILWCMKKHYMLVFGVLLFLVLIVPLVTSNVQAFNKNGPSPIPGDLIPFPGMAHDKKHDSKIHSVIMPGKK
jgi:hypothetical protein